MLHVLLNFLVVNIFLVKRKLASIWYLDRSFLFGFVEELMLKMVKVTTSENWYFLRYVLEMPYCLVIVMIMLLFCE